MATNPWVYTEILCTYELKGKKHEYILKSNHRDVDEAIAEARRTVNYSFLPTFKAEFKRYVVSGMEL